VLGALMLHEALRVGGAGAVAGPLARLAMGTDSVLLQVLSRSAAARARADGTALDEVAGELEGIGALLFAAEAAHAAAEAHGAAGANVARVASARRASALLGRCPGAAPPWLPPRTEDEPLSGRQREVAVLAARGLSSREIAERLFVSVRTVDNHLYRIYAKLGVESRDELAVALELDDQGE
jgi:DNA-binding CsgD family transcriptional regulator